MAAIELSQIDCRHLPAYRGTVDPDLAAIALPQVASPPSLVAMDQRTHAAWGKSLSLSQYLHRERVLRASAFARRGLRAWILHRGDQVLASCETYACDVAVTVGRTGRAGRDGTSLRGEGHGIASVHVPHDQRGHGHASDLLTRVHAVLRGEGALLCYLLSEIGPTLYARLGYVPRPLFTRRYAAAPASESHGAVPPWRYLNQAQLPTVVSALSARKASLSIEISVAQIEWHLLRTAFYSRCLGRPESPHIGAVAGDAVALWAADPREGILRVLAIYPGAALSTPGAVFDPRAESAANVRNVLHAARTVAGQLGIPAIELWENPSNALYLRGGVQAVGGDVPMVLPLTSAPANSGLRGEEWQDYERAHWL